MEESSTEAKQYLTFNLNEETFGVDVLKVREVMDRISVTQIPRSPDYMQGVINLRGSVVPVIDLKQKFAITEECRNAEECIIVLEIDHEGETLAIGAVADGVQEVLDLFDDQIDPAPKQVVGLNNEFIKGMGKKDDEFVIILDLQKIFAGDELDEIAA